MSGQSRRGDDSMQNAQPVAASWDRAVARSLVRFAARKAPRGLTERLEEEWLADLMGRQGGFARIRFGLGCCWATRVIAREFGAATATASAASGERVLVALGGFDFSRISRRTIALIAIVCLHVGILYLYLAGFGRTIVPSSVDPMDGGFIIRPTNHVQPPPLPPPTFTHTFVDTVPAPDVPINFPADQTAITVAHSPRPNVAPVPPAKPVSIATGGPGAGFPDTEDYYPPAARRLGEAGAAAVRVCVDSDGRLTGAPAIVQSSGIARLDAGALRLAQAGSGHYRPTTENGQPVSSCYAFRIRFQLEEQ